MAEVYVPSRGRPNDVPTVLELIRDGVWPTVVVPTSEYNTYRDALPVEATVLSCPVEGIGLVRQWILEDARKRGTGRFWMLDDDLDDPRYRPSFKAPYEFIKWSEWLAAIEDLTPQPKVAIAGGFTRQYGWPEDSAIPDRRVGYAVLINPDAPFDYWPLLHEDTDACLQVLAAGWRTVKLPQFVYHTTTMNLRGGGCAVDYDRGAGRTAAFALVRKWNSNYPGLVHTKTNKEGNTVTRVNWKVFRHWNKTLAEEKV